jgi:hypothetical protein
MKLPDAIEAELRIIEADYDRRPGQHAGPARLRGLRSAIERDLAALRQRQAEAVRAAYWEAMHDFESTVADEEIEACWNMSQAKAALGGPDA